MKPEEHVAGFGTSSGELLVGGIRLGLLAERVGSTPFFAYDRCVVDRRVERLREALPHSVELSYAMKANPMPALVQHLASLVDRIDVASAHELRTALDTRLSPDKISFAGPGKTEPEVRQAVAAGVLIEAESTTELRRIAVAADSLGVAPKVVIRVNPAFSVKGSGMRMGGGPQQFGIDAEEVPSILTEFRELDPIGFHIFAGSQNLRAEVIAEAQALTVETMIQLAGGLPGGLRYLGLGGGFGIPYTLRDQPLDLDLLSGRLSELLDTQISGQFPAATTVIELGRYLVGECGVYVTRVLDRKISRGRTYLVVDGGMHHQLAASGNFGQAIRRNYPLVIGNRLDSPSEVPTTVVGCLCTPLDLLGDEVQLPPAEIGDLVVLFQAGAYGLTASPAAFLGHPPAMEVLV